MTVVPMKESGPVSSLSFIEPHEEAEAKRLINDQFVALTGKPYDMRVAGYLVAVKLYIRPEELKVETKDGNLKTLYMPQSVLTEDKYQSVSGVVVGIGPQAYKGVLADGSPKYPEGPWCKIGDIVLLPRFESMSISFRGVAMALLPDDRVAAVISDPTDVQPINTADKF